MTSQYAAYKQDNFTAKRPHWEEGVGMGYFIYISFSPMDITLWR
jgi:hypothetical protein